MKTINSEGNFLKATVILKETLGETLLFCD